MLSYLAVYVPVILVGLGLSALMTWGMLTLYNDVIFSGLSLFIGSTINGWAFLASFAGVLGVFGISALLAIYALKSKQIVDQIK